MRKTQMIVIDASGVYSWSAFTDDVKKKIGKK